MSIDLGDLLQSIEAFGERLKPVEGSDVPKLEQHLEHRPIAKVFKLRDVRTFGTSGTSENIPFREYDGSEDEAGQDVAGHNVRSRRNDHGSSVEHVHTNHVPDVLNVPNQETGL